jgi:hypothetical protein
MNDILLFMTEIEAARKRGKDSWWERTGGVGDLLEYMEAAVCRAQVQKMVDAVQEWAVSADTEATVLKGDIWIPSDDIEWQALKAAGEGK